MAAPALAVDAPKGAARRWEASLPVGLYGQVNLRTGRVLTTIPITGWPGRGPSIQFNLYHNQVSAWGPIGIVPGDGDLDDMLTGGDFDPMLDIVLTPSEEQTPLDLAIGDFDGSGIVDVTDMGEFLDALEGGGAAAASGGGPVEPCTPDWRHSYSAKVELSMTGVWLTRDDGTIDAFTWDETDPAGERLKPPPGVFDTMYYNYANDGFTLVSKNQWKAYFKWHEATPDWYRLEWISDAALANGQPANKVLCHYEPSPSNIFTYGKLISVEDATRTGSPLAGRKLLFSYNSLGKLKEITDPINRHWKLLYEVSGVPNNPTQEGTGYLRAVEDPMTYRITVAYNGVCDLASVADKNGDAYGFEYHNGRLMTITDPSPFTSQTQVFSYYKIMFSNDQFCEYTDRRGEHWYTMFDTVTGNLMEVEDPLGHPQSLDYDDLTVHPTMHEPVTYTDALDHTWEFEWDAEGNLLNSEDPLGNLTAFTYDSLNNLTTITPPGATPGTTNLAKRTTMEYADVLNPTKATKIKEPAATVGGAVPETIIEHFGIGLSHGLLKKVTPPPANATAPVETGKKYVWQNSQSSGGFRLEEGYAEGFPGSVDLSSPASVSGTSSSNGAGQTIGSSNTVTCPDLSHDGNGNAIVVNCGYCTLFAPPDPEAGLFNDGRPKVCLPPDQFDDSFPLRSGCFTSLLPYRPMGQPVSQRWCTLYPNPQLPAQPRDIDYQWDSLGRLRNVEIKSSEVTGDINNPISREFQYDPDWSTGTNTTTGPDGQVTVVSTDAAGRVTSWVRKIGTTEIMRIDTTYYDNNRLDTITRANGTRTKHIYDDTGRLTFIKHERQTGPSTWVRLHELQYVWTTDSLVDYIFETDEAGTPSVIDFIYDNRNRLTEEKRTGATFPYWYVYAYDLAGNRTSKIQKNVLNDAPIETTLYTYDVNNPSVYGGLLGSQGNRLMKSVATNHVTSSVVTRWYEYDRRGRAKVVIRQYSGDEWFHGTRIAYDSRELVWMTLAFRWKVNAQGNPVNCEYESAMEYRYDNGRRRYLTRPLELETFLPTSPTAGTWHDYDASDIWNDYTIAMNGQTPTITNFLSHEPGIAQRDAATSAISYLHGNLIGTTEVMSNGSGTNTRRTVFSAFGEPVYENGSPDTRYGYAGAWGYQEAGSTDPLAELGWLHVGARYYDPAAGRFMQRDPIGVWGGSNTYAYVGNSPAGRIDPSGLQGIMLPGYPQNPFTSEPLPGHPGYRGPPPRPWIPPHRLIDCAESQRGKNGNDSDHHAFGVYETGRTVGMMSGPLYYPVGAMASGLSAIGLTIGELIFPSSDWQDDITANWTGFAEFLDNPPS
ncbi:MAG: hypothetical protein HZA51_13860 [Planctomycetes bacterium]|nr:hypothetical protein [Planctomycetota bacterium]